MKIVSFQQIDIKNILSKFNKNLLRSKFKN